MPLPDSPPGAPGAPGASWMADLVAAIQLPQELQPLTMGQPYVAVLPPGATLEHIQPGSNIDRELAGLPPTPAQD